MRNRFSILSTSILALSLAACGGPPEEAEDTTAEPAPLEEAVPSAEGEADAAPQTEVDQADAEAEGEAEEASEDAAEPAPAPSATPKPTTAATAAPVAVVTQPASFATCMVCHATTPGQNGVGPSLAGVVGRKAGAVSGFSYSAPMKASGLTWNDSNLERYLVDPNALVSGGTMPAPGVNAAQAREIVAYLKTL